MFPILITVTENERSFYGYDELSHTWVRFGFDGKILESWADAEDLSSIVAAQYIDGVLYAYDKDGYFYSVDTETFLRTKLGDGIYGMTASLEAWDKSNNEQVYFVEDIPYQVIDLTYGKVTDESGNTVTKLYGVVMAHHVSLWRDDFAFQVVELDIQTGAILRVIIEDAQMDGMDMRPANLLYRDGYLYAIDGFISGMISKINPNDGSKSIQAICPKYWGDFNGGRSMIEDPLTGEVYAIRDMRTQYVGSGDYDETIAASFLCKMGLGVGYIEEIAAVGSNLRIVGLFIK